MKWICPDCRHCTLIGAPIRPSKVNSITHDIRTELQKRNENICHQCGEVKEGILVGDCPNHGGAPGSRSVVYRSENPSFHYCRKCDTHLYYTQDRDGEYPTNADPFCPLCHTSKDEDELDFHHWNYQENIGIHICRDCHTEIHDGLRASEQTKRAPENEDWRFESLTRLIKLHKETHDGVSSWEELAWRYNVPSEYKWILERVLTMADGTSNKQRTTMSNQVALADRRRCDGCGVRFEPKLDGDLCPTCVDIIIEHNLDSDDWEQHRLREEYGDT